MEGPLACVKTPPQLIEQWLDGVSKFLYLAVGAIVGLPFSLQQ